MKIRNEGDRKTEECSLFDVGSGDGHLDERGGKKLRLNPACGSHSHSRLTITQTPDTPVIPDMVTVPLSW